MKLIPVGRLTAAHGLKGELRLRYYNEGGDAPLRYPSFFVEDNGKEIELKPAEVRTHQKQFLIKFKGLEGADAIRFLIGKEVFVREEDLPPRKKANTTITGSSASRRSR